MPKQRTDTLFDGKCLAEQVRLNTQRPFYFDWGNKDYQSDCGINIGSWGPRENELQKDSFADCNVRVTRAIIHRRLGNNSPKGKTGCCRFKETQNFVRDVRVARNTSASFICLRFVSIKVYVCDSVFLLLFYATQTIESYLRVDETVAKFWVHVPRFSPWLIFHHYLASRQ